MLAIMLVSEKQITRLNVLFLMGSMHLPENQTRMHTKYSDKAVVRECAWNEWINLTSFVHDSSMILRNQIPQPLRTKTVHIVAPYFEAAESNSAISFQEKKNQKGKNCAKPIADLDSGASKYLGGGKICAVFVRLGWEISFHGVMQYKYSVLIMKLHVYCRHRRFTPFSREH